MEFKHPVVIIFGAGATRGGMEGEDVSSLPPVDGDFFRIANQLQVRDKGTTRFVGRVLKSVRSLYERTNDIGLEYYYRDIDIRKQVLDFAPPRHNPKNWTKPIEDLEELIRRVLIHTTCELDDNRFYRPRVSTIHRSVLDQLEEGDTIITFNYDLLIEQSFSEEFKWHPKDGYGVEIDMQEEASNKWKSRVTDRSRCLLLKLHGSINWQKEGDSLKLKDRPYKVSGEHRSRVAILAPGWRKPIETKPYNTLWKKARNSIEGARTIIVLGYSLPETDFLAKSFLIEAIESKRFPDKRKRVCKLEQLHLVDLNIEIRKKFAGMFNPAMNYRTYIAEYKSLSDFHDVLKREMKS